MKITYDSKYDVLYLKFVEGKKQVINKNLPEDITVDVDEKGKIVGMEFLERIAAYRPQQIASNKGLSKSLRQECIVSATFQ